MAGYTPLKRPTLKEILAHEDEAILGINQPKLSPMQESDYFPNEQTYTPVPESMRLGQERTIKPMGGRSLALLGNYPTQLDSSSFKPLSNNMSMEDFSPIQSAEASPMQLEQREPSSIQEINKQQTIQRTLGNQQSSEASPSYPERPKMNKLEKWGRGLYGIGSGLTLMGGDINAYNQLEEEARQAEKARLQPYETDLDRFYKEQALKRQSANDLTDAEYKKAYIGYLQSESGRKSKDQIAKTDHFIDREVNRQVAQNKALNAKNAIAQDKKGFLSKMMGEEPQMLPEDYATVKQQMLEGLGQPTTMPTQTAQTGTVQMRNIKTGEIKQVPSSRVQQGLASGMYEVVR